MQSFEEHIQERLGAALHTLAFIEQRAGSAPEGRHMHALLKQCRHLVEELEHGFSLLQEATSQHAALRQQVEAASTRAGLLFELSPVPCIVIEEDGTIVDANAAATRLLNTSLRYLQGKSFELFLGSDRETFGSWLSRLSQGTESDRRAVLLRPREQRPKQVVVIASPEVSGRLTLIVVNKDDVGEALALPQSDTRAHARRPHW
jgi:PAS domain-containing protein